MFCKHCEKQINEDAKFCKFCGTKVVREELYFAKPRSSFLEKINWRKLLFNKCIAILAGVIFIVWISSGDDASNNSGGTKASLPAPIQQVSDDVVKFTPLAPDVSLANGAILKKNNVYLQEHGELLIKNGTSLDAVAKLISGGTSILTVYIKANNSYTMTDISDGIYWLAFAQGLDWDSTTQKFRRNTQYSAFDETFDFTTAEDSQYYHYPGFEVTLNPVVGGTAETSSVDPAQFNAY